MRKKFKSRINSHYLQQKRKIVWDLMINDIIIMLIKLYKMPSSAKLGI